MITSSQERFNLAVDRIPQRILAQQPHSLQVIKQVCQAGIPRTTWTQYSYSMHCKVIFYVFEDSTSEISTLGVRRYGPLIWRTFGGHRGWFRPKNVGIGVSVHALHALHAIISLTLAHLHIKSSW
jgi:hypothetical protein